VNLLPNISILIDYFLRSRDRKCSVFRPCRMSNEGEMATQESDPTSNLRRRKLVECAQEKIEQGECRFRLASSAKSPFQPRNY
jgi:hypothetical protein